MDSIEIIIDIRKIVRSLNLESKSIQKDFGLNITQLMCLGHLENSPNYRSTHKELMNLLSTNSSTVTGIINRLEKKGYVARLPKAGDKRITYLALTASGLKLLQETPNILHDRLSQKLEKLNDDEKKQVKKSLDIIISAMQIDKVEALPLLTVEEHLE